MSADRSLLEEATGYLGVGSVELLGILAIFDAATKFYDLVVVYTSSSALFAIPCLALSYLMGLLTVVAYAELKGSTSPLSPALLSTLVRTKNDQLVSRFCEAERQAKLIGASSVSLGVLALGLLAEVPHAAQFKVIAVTSVVILIALCFACRWLANRVEHRAVTFVLLALETRDA